MIGHKADGNDYDRVISAAPLVLAKEVKNIGLQPRLCGWPAAALVYQLKIAAPIALDCHTLRHQPARFLQLRLILAALRPGQRNPVGSKYQLGAPPLFSRELLQTTNSMVRDRLDEPRVIEKHPQLIHDGRAFSHRFSGRSDVLAILAAARVGTEG